MNHSVLQQINPEIAAEITYTGYPHNLSIDIRIKMISLYLYIQQMGIKHFLFTIFSNSTQLCKASATVSSFRCFLPP